MPEPSDASRLPWGNGIGANAPDRTSCRASLLIVDDEPPLLDVISRYLEREGFAVSTAGTAADALALLEVDQVDIMLCDVGLPDMDAVALVRAARCRAPAMRVLMFSGRHDAQVAETLLHAGASAYITKPLPLRELRDIVDRAVAARSAAHAPAHDSIPPRTLPR